ncbi:hypothetical protein IC620_08620 [Hazenella sp. IB182357]|uniref:Uncharacterized protein n=1 Tax=Polycladospora coralii TaxID=2771432 RepID=A0A926RT64_9BACL|nr:hypothetical protein [Polycladospora coralii]MBD1372420.1 hypothetical protein [Polycladospora coralii]
MRSNRIKVIAVLFIIYGMVLTFYHITMGSPISENEMICSAIMGCNLQEWSFAKQLIYLFFDGLFPLFAGIGLFLQERWGWWIGTTFLCYGIIDKLMVISMLFQLGGSIWESYNILPLVYLGAFLASFIFLINGNVQAVFAIKKQSLSIHLAILIGISTMGFITKEILLHTL